MNRTSRVESLSSRQDDVMTALGWSEVFDGDDMGKEEKDFEFGFTFDGEASEITGPDHDFGHREAEPVRKTGYDAIYTTLEKIKKKQMMEKLNNDGPAKKKVATDAPARRKVSEMNEEEVAIFIQRQARMWIAQVRVRSLLHIREKLEEGIRVRTVAAIQPALNASKALAHFFTVKEHDIAKKVMFSVMEEESLKGRMFEIIDSLTKTQDKVPLDMLDELESIVARVYACREGDRFAFRTVYVEQILRLHEAALAQKEVFELLRNAQAAKPSSAIALADAVYHFDTQRSKFDDVWPRTLGLEEYSQCRVRLIKIQHEEGPLRDIINLCQEGQASMVNKEELKSSSELKSSLDVSTIDTDSLSEAIRICEDLEATDSVLETEGGHLVLELGRTVVAMRLALRYSLENSEAWDEVEKSTKECKTTLAKLVAQRALQKQQQQGEEPQTESEDDKSTADLSLALSAEISSIMYEVDRRNGVHNTASAIRIAIDARDAAGLELALEEAEVLKLSARETDTTTQGLLEEGHAMMEKLSKIYTTLVEVLFGIQSEPNRSCRELKKEVAQKGGFPYQESKKTLEKLKEAISVAESVGIQDYNAKGKKDGWLLEEALRLHDLATNKVAPMLAEYVVTIPNRGNMEASVKICDSEGLDLPHLEEVRALIQLSDEKLQQEQLRAATKNQDTSRKTEMLTLVRGTLLSQNENLFTLDKFPGLKDPEVFGRRMGMRNKTLVLGMLKWTNESIHTTLTELEEDPSALPATVSTVVVPAVTTAKSSIANNWVRTAQQGKFSSGGGEQQGDNSSTSLIALRKLALKMFRNIIAYMEDRPSERPIELGQEVLVTGLAMKGLRDEIYVQLMKQLTENPGTRSRMLGWNLLALCCVTFPPSDKLDYYLEQFLRSHSDDDAECSSLKILEKLQNTVQCGERPCAPTIVDITRCRENGGNISGFNFRLVDTPATAVSASTS